MLLSTHFKYSGISFLSLSNVAITKYALVLPFREIWLQSPARRPVVLKIYISTTTSDPSRCLVLKLELDRFSPHINIRVTWGGTIGGKCPPLFSVPRNSFFLATEVEEGSVCIIRTG